MSDSARTAAHALSAVELFAGLQADALEEIAACSRVRRLAPQTRIFDQGAPAERAHALIHGSVGIFQSGGDGGQVIVRFIGPGQTFGTVALFTDRHYPAEARTLTDALEASWSEHDLLRLMDRHAGIAMNVIGIIGRRLQEVQERVRELSTQRAEQRVAHAVLRLAQQAGHDTAYGTAIEFPLRRKDLAQISGTTLHTVSRILTSWTRAGLLASDHRRLTIRSPAAIQRIAHAPA
ncbi:MAG: Crp/Fnr family transcriptional regulator [Steroidobacteraceae bacterium]